MKSQPSGLPANIAESNSLETMIIPRSSIAIAHIRRAQGMVSQRELISTNVRASSLLLIILGAFVNALYVAKDHSQSNVQRNAGKKHREDTIYIAIHSAQKRDAESIVVINVAKNSLLNMEAKGGDFALIAASSVSQRGMPRESGARENGRQNVSLTDLRIGRFLSAMAGSA